tara:strand:- start:48 stop:647 length:600 start_codon:yes stop_codon:yes gene_type:complete
MKDLTDPLHIFSYLRIYKNVVHEGINKNILEICKSSIPQFQKSGIANNDGSQQIQEKIRSVEGWNLDNITNDSKTAQYLCNLFKKIFGEYTRTYMASISFKNVGFSITTIDVLKYIKGGHYVYHHDDTFSAPRTFSCIYLINDDYEGGELCFKTLSGSSELILPSEPNSLIMWPSNFIYQHTVKPVTEGERYSVVSWIR